MNKCILVEGSFERGHKFYGPFDSRPEARNYGKRFTEIVPLPVIPLEEPDNYEGRPGPFILLIGDGSNGHSIVGTFHCPHCATQWGREHDADSEGGYVMSVELQKAD